jgi:aryl-alcohol dehydrogenase-like predicted oxidoreductase
VGELLETLEEQVRAGRIRYYAASNWTPVRLRMARVYAQEHGLKGFVADQILWNLGVPSKLPYGDPTCGFMDEERFVVHEETGMAVVPYQSQAFGMFHRMLNKTLDKLKADIRDMYRMPETIIRFNRAQQIMDKTGFTMTQVVLGFLLSQPFSTIPIMGCKTVEQLNDSMGAADVNIDNELIIYLIHGK